MAAPDSDRSLVQSLHRLSREISLTASPTPLQRRNFASVARKARLLSLLFEDLLRGDPALPRSAALCLKEILVVLQRFKALLADCATRSRARLLLQADAVTAEFHDLTLDLSSLLGILPLADLDLSDDVRDLVELVRRQCRRGSLPSAEGRLRSEILDMIREIERGIVPDRSRLESIFERLGLRDSRSCRDEIECLEREIGDRVAEKWTPALVALVGLIRYAKCVVFGASTPRPEPVQKPGTPTAVADPTIPADFRCPISLDLMRDPVVVASGQTYDRESITRWIASGHATCPNSGQALSHTDLIPNRALRNLIARWCREQDLPFDGKDDGSGGEANPAGGNKAALEAARMTATFLVQKLAASSSSVEAANRVVHELRLLAKTGSENRTFVAEAGAIPLLLPLLASDDPALQVNAVTALLNLSILEANKKRIMHADGGINSLIHVLADGSTWRAKENAAATMLSLSSVHAYRRRLGRYPRAVEALVDLVTAGPTSTQKDALAAILSLAGDRENIARLVEGGVVEAALHAVGVADVTEEAVAVLAAVAKRGDAEAVGRAEGSIKKMVGVLRRGSDWARESAAAVLVLVCRKSVGSAVAELATMPAIECVIWELMASGTERTRRKAASLGRICRRWTAAVEEADRTARLSAMDITTPSTPATARA